MRAIGLSMRHPVAILAAIAVGACSPHGPEQPVALDGGVEEVLLPFPPDGSAVTWTSWAGPFVRDYCVQCHNPQAPCYESGCHTQGDTRTPNFEDESAFVAMAADIRCGISVTESPTWECGSTEPKTYPKFLGQNPLPTDPQRDLMVGWIDAGCP
jgi:hypothetical protein